MGIFRQRSRPAPALACGRCRKPLAAIGMNHGFGGQLPTLYNGVVCNVCRKLECTQCKGSRVDAPCSWCGASVSPAYEHLIRA
jgi:hypothetical protein